MVSLLFRVSLQYVLGSSKLGIKKTDISQNKQENIDLINASDWKNLAVTQDPTDHDPGHPKVQNKWFFSF